MTKVYHKSKDLIVLDILPKAGKGITLQQKIIFAVGGGIQSVFDAKEIWFYNDDTGVFVSYKSRPDLNQSCLLITFLESHHIHVCTSGYSTTLPNETMNYCFATERDKFLFKLKF